MNTPYFATHQSITKREGFLGSKKILLATEEGRDE
jgi:hypothetical protein